MKSVTKKLVKLLSATFVVFFILGNSLSISAQEKPKGKTWPAPESAIKTKNPIKPDEALIKEGKDLYSQNCKSCHGLKGKGDGTKAEKLEISCGDFTSEEYAKTTDGEAYWKTTEGRKPMPSFKEKLSDHERWAIIYYIRTLSKLK